MSLSSLSSVRDRYEAHAVITMVSPNSSSLFVVEVFCDMESCATTGHSPSREADCSICQEKNESPVDSTFCGNHWYHKICKKNWAEEKLTKLFNEKVNYRLLSEFFLVNMVFPITNMGYFLEIPEEGLPNCPECRRCPTTTLLITVKDILGLKLPIANVIVKYPLQEQILLSLRKSALPITGSDEERQTPPMEGPPERVVPLPLQRLRLQMPPPLPFYFEHLLQMPPPPLLVYRPPVVDGYRPPSAAERAFFEFLKKAFKAYSVAQAGMNYLQKYPELAATIFKVQKVLMVVDFVELGCTVYVLYNNIKQKLQQVSHKKMLILSTVSLVALAALSYGAVLGIQAHFKPAFSPGEILGGLGLSAENLKGIKLSWDAPTIQTAMQCLYVSRIVTSIASAFFSKNPKLCLLNAASQALSLFRISQLQWLNLEQTLEGPFPKFWSWSSSDSMQLKSFTTKVTCMIQPSCTKEASHLQAAVQSVYKYVDTLFKKESLTPYWMVSYQNADKVGHALYYKVVLSGNSLGSCVCTLPIKVVKLAMRAVDVFHGVAGVEIWTAS